VRGLELLGLLLQVCQRQLYIRTQA
jgi:hypothetical protein